MKRIVKRIEIEGIDVRRKKRRGGKNEEREGKNGGKIRKKVEEKIIGKDEVEMIRKEKEMNEERIRKNMLKLKIGMFLIVERSKEMIKKKEGINKIEILNRSEIVEESERKIEGKIGDELDLVGVVEMSVDEKIMEVEEIDDLIRLEEIKEESKIEKNKNIEKLDKLRIKRGRMGKRRVEDGREKIGIKMNIIEKEKKEGLREKLIRKDVKIREEKREKKKGIGRKRILNIRIGNRMEVWIVRKEEKKKLLGLKKEIEVRVEERDKIEEIRNGIGKDEIEGKEKKFYGWNNEKNMFFKRE